MRNQVDSELDNHKQNTARGVRAQDPEAEHRRGPGEGGPTCGLKVVSQVGLRGFATRKSRLSFASTWTPI